LSRSHHHPIRTLSLLQVKVGIGKAPKQGDHDTAEGFDAAVRYPAENTAGIFGLVGETYGGVIE
jgi:hypothetical protein